MRNIPAEIDALLRPVPEGARGGTFIYCPFTEEFSLGTIRCRDQRGRFRTGRAYRRHWRRFHGAVPAFPFGLREGDPLLGYDDEVQRFRESGAGQHSGITWPLSAAGQENADLLRKVNERVRGRLGGA